MAAVYMMTGHLWAAAFIDCLKGCNKDKFLWFFWVWKKKKTVCLFVCISVVKFNHRHNIWTIKDRDVVFDEQVPFMNELNYTMACPLSEVNNFVTFTFMLNCLFRICCCKKHSFCHNLLKPFDLSSRTDNNCVMQAFNIYYVNI